MGESENILKLDRAAAGLLWRVSNVAESLFGFDPQHVVPLESAEEPSHYCMFEVLGTQYQVRDGRISVYWKGE